MRYQIFSLQQSTLVEYGLNVEDALLLDWILNWKDGTGMKREFIEEVQYIGYWVDYETVVKELPILFKQPTENMDEKELKKLLRNNKDKVGRMLNGRLSKVLSTYKLVYRGDKSQIGSKVFVVINREAIDKLKNIGYQIDNNYENKKAPTFAEVEANENPKKQIDNNIITQNKEKDSNKYTKNKNIDYENLAYERCICKYEDFENFTEMRKTFLVGAELRRIAEGVN